MNNYAPPLPRDKYSEPLHEYPSPKLALARHTSENATASSVISVSHDATALEIAAIGAGAVMRWVTTAETAASVISAVANADYDHVIPPNTMRRFVIPIESNPQVESVQGINRELGLYQRFAVKTFGIASIMSAQF